MNAAVHAINSVGQAFVDFALPMLIQSIVLILILLLVDLVLRRRVRAVFRYWIWMLVLLKLVLPPSLWSPISFGTWFGETLEAPTAALQESPVSQDQEPEDVWQPQAQLGDGLLPRSPIAKGFALDAATPVVPPPAPTPAPQTEYNAVKTTVTPAPAEPTTSVSWQALVLLAWTATALALLLLLLQRAYFVRGLVAQAQEAPRQLTAALDECRASMGLARPIALRVSPNATSPAVCGLLRPAILIPKNLAPKLQPRDLQAVLLHELAHVRRGDLWVNLIQTLLQIAYFYNPLLWLANLMIRRVREQAVDEAVLVAMGDTARDYPEMLINVAKLAFKKRPALSLRLIGVVESKSALSGRIKHILGRPLPKSARLGMLGLVVVFLIAAVFLPMAKARPMTDRARNVMTLAREEARQLNHRYVGTEHILLALAREEDAVSTQVLENLGADLDTLRAEVGKLLKPGTEPVTRRRLPRTPRAKRAMKYAREEARTLRHDYIGTEHILLGLMREKEGIAAQVLANLGVTWQQIRAGVLSLVQPGDVRAVERMADGPDTDGDGLSDFQEVHKYRTDPTKRDSDGDGTPDGDWDERREYAYSVRTVFRFLPPLDEKALYDDFQDARVLKQTNDYVEIEVIHYPLATVYESIGENRNWRRDYAHLTDYLAPGATTNWDEPMRRALLAELKADGIDVDALSDKQVVEQVSDWLLKKSRSLDRVFTTFYVHCPNGRPEVFPGLEDAYRHEFERDKNNYDWTIEDHFDHEVLGKGMFYNKTHGSCTSTAVYLTTVLRALGIPTRMVLVSPAVDASDRAQILMTKNAITHHRVRETLLAGLRKSSHGFTNHTLNEVYIGNRWVRLDSSALGVPILGVHRFGLQTHLYTINDIGDIDLAATWGVRYAKGLRSEYFLHSNPYSAVEIDDLFGAHSDVANPPFTAQDLGTRSKPDIFIFSPEGVGVWYEALEIVKDVTYNKTGRHHQREFYENLFEGVWQKKPGDVLVLLFALDSDERVPEGYEDLLPEPWAQIESRLRQDQTVELAGEARDMKIILLATPRAAQLKSLVQDSSSLRALGPSEEAKTTGATEERPGWLVEFANGVKVRLLGVCTHPSAGQPWWKPDGTPLEIAPYETTGSRLEEEEGYVYYEYAAEILGGDHPSIRWKVPGGNRGSDTGQAIGPNGARLAYTHAYTANQPLDAEVANVFLGLAADEWETRAVHATPNNEGSYTLKDDYAIAFGSAYEKEGHTYVPVTTNIPYTTMASRLVAVDVEGNLHTGSSSGSGGNVLHSTTYTFDVALERIKEFRFETRSYVWVEFRNVSLRPGQSTDLQVHFAATYNPDADGGALAELEPLGLRPPQDPTELTRLTAPDKTIRAELPNGVTVEFLAYSQLTGEGLKWWTPQGEPATIPGLYEADVEGHGTLLALRMTPEPEAGVRAWRVQPPDIRDELKPVWQANNSDIWLLPLGEGRSYANVEIAAQVRDPVVIKTITTDQLATSGSGEIGARGLWIKYLAQADPGATAFAVHSAWSYPDLPTWPEVLAAIDTAGQIHSLRPARADPLEMQQMMVPDPFGGPRRLQVDLPTERLAGIVIEGYSERAGRVTFRNLSLRPGQPTEVHIEVEAEQRGPWWHPSEYSSQLEHLGRLLSEQAETRGGQYPANRAELQAYFTDTEWNWLQEHAVYIAAGKSSTDVGPVPLAYEKTLLPAGFGTYVLFSDGDVSFQTPDQLQKLGITQASQAVPRRTPAPEPVTQTKADEVPSPSVKAELPNGVTVELLAYSHLVPRGGLFWFDPQGQETTIPGVYEADVEGLGTILALRVQPSEARLLVQVYRGPDSQNIEKQWQLPETDIWLLALGQERSFANLRIITELTLPPVIETIALTEENMGQLVEVNRCGIASIVDLHTGDTYGAEIVIEQMGLSAMLGTDTETVEAMGLQDVAEPPTLGFSTINAPDSHQSIVALLDKEGRTYPVNLIEGSYPNAIYGARLWPSKLAGIVVEAAPVHSADVRFRNISLTPQRITEIRIKPAPDRQLSWRRSYASLLREVLTNSIARYRKDHGGRFPSQLEALRRNHDDDAFRWLLANIAYLGQPDIPEDDARTVIAYDKTLLAQGQGTYVFYSDGQLEFEGPLELQELGLLSNDSRPDTWHDLGAAIPPDANDTRTLAPGIRLDGIGSAPDGRVFISTVRDAAETDGRQYRFVLTTKAGKTLEPIYYGSLAQADGKLWEKHTFDTYYHHRELESFRLQWRSAAGQVAVAPAAHDEILAAATDAQGSPLALQAPPGQFALAFDGQDDYLYVPDSENLRNAEQLKIEMWFKPQFPPGPCWPRAPTWGPAESASGASASP